MQHNGGEFDPIAPHGDFSELGTELDEYNRSQAAQLQHILLPLDGQHDKHSRSLAFFRALKQLNGITEHTEKIPDVTATSNIATRCGMSFEGKHPISRRGLKHG